jgi:hypothetical protein
MEPRKTPKPKLTAEAAYENSHLVARDLLDRIADLLQDMPAPGNDDHPIHWGHVATSAGNGCFSVRTTCSRNRRTASRPSSRGGRFSRGGTQETSWAVVGSDAPHKSQKYGIVHFRTHKRAPLSRKKWPRLRCSLDRRLRGV